MHECSCNKHLSGVVTLYILIFWIKKGLWSCLGLGYWRSWSSKGWSRSRKRLSWSRSRMGRSQPRTLKSGLQHWFVAKNCVEFAQTWVYSLHTTGWSIKKTTPNFGSHFDTLTEIFYHLFWYGIKPRLFDISCDKMNDIAIILLDR